MSSEPILKRIDLVENLTDKAYNTIKNYIMSLPLNSNEKLSETTLAETLGISKTPVREALRILANQGLVEIQPRKGTFLAEFTNKDIKEIFDIREYLEALAINELFERINKEIIISLEKIANDAHQASLNNDKLTYNKHDDYFHKKIVALSDNSRLYEMFEKIQIQVQRVRAHSIKLPGRPGKSDSEHLLIVQALKNKDREKAEQYLREHINNVKHDLIKFFRERNN
jgi:DNA-binding GntR family transcriptional regulator